MTAPDRPAGIAGTDGGSGGGSLVAPPALPAPFVLLGDPAADVCEDGVCAVPGAPPA